MNNSISYKIIMDHYKHDDGKSALFLQVIIDRKKKMINIGLSIQSYLFNSKTGKVLHHLTFSKDEAFDFNLILNNKLSKAHDIVLNARLNGDRLTAHRFKVLYTGNKEVGKKDFISFMKQEIEDLSEVRSPGSITTYKRTLRLISGFHEQLKFNEINPGLIEDFERYLIKQNQAPSTRSLHHKNVKMFLNIADKRGVSSNEAYRDFAIKRMRGHREFLNTAELDKLKKLFHSEDLNYELQNVLEYFLFSCYTGLRISDVQILTSSSINSKMLVFTPVKTKNIRKVVKIPLADFAYSLIKGKNGKLFKTICDQGTNKALKEIAKAASVNKNITFHVARHTFATFFLSVGGKVEVLQRLLGHSKLETTMEYVHIMENTLIDQMKLMN